MVTIIFESHGTTYDNEAKLSSGWYDVELSELGVEQAKDLGRRYKDEQLDAVFCSDLKRSYKTGQVAFADKNLQLMKDSRLRECDYGELTRHPSDEVELLKERYIVEPFPGGESYKQVTERIKNFLNDLQKDWDGKKIMIIGHRATQYGLEHLIKKVPLGETVTAAWKWQPGWIYYLEKID